MIIGVPKQTHGREHRVGLTPFAVGRLARQGHDVLVEMGAGTAAHFSDHHFEEVGGRIVYSSDEIYRRADLVCQVARLTAADLDRLGPGSVIAAFHHLAVLPRELVRRLVELETTLIGYELIEDEDGLRSVLHPFSEMAGQLAVHLAAHHLQAEAGGRGVLLGNVPGVPPPTVLVLGAGAAGSSSARQALVSGAHAIVLDVDMNRLRAVHDAFDGHVVTAMASERRVDEYARISDVVVGAVLVPGAPAPIVLREETVKGMKPGSVIVDLSIDQGGCVETSRPTTPSDPTFVAHHVVHYCVPNMTANIPRTASRALANTALPYLTALADQGLEAALAADPGLAAGVYLYRGNVVNRSLGEILGMESAPIEKLLESRGRR